MQCARLVAEQISAGLAHTLHIYDLGYTSCLLQPVQRSFGDTLRSASVSPGSMRECGTPLSEGLPAGAFILRGAPPPLLEHLVRVKGQVLG